MSARAAFIFSTISSRLRAEVHSLKGFITIIMSASSTAIGTSAVPILATTCLISGNFSFRIFSAFRDVSILLVNELPAGKVICMAKSPSSRVGINSAPIFVNRNSETINAAKAVANVVHTWLRQKFSVLIYALLRRSKNLSVRVGFMATSFLRNRDAIIGT